MEGVCLRFSRSPKNHFSDRIPTGRIYFRPTISSPTAHPSTTSLAFAPSLLRLKSSPSKKARYAFACDLFHTLLLAPHSPFYAPEVAFTTGDIPLALKMFSVLLKSLQGRAQPAEE